MPIKLRSREYKIIAVVLVIAALSLGVSLKYFSRAFPEASIEMRVNRADSGPVARAFLAGRGIHLEGWRHAAVFNYDDEAKSYLERTLGLARMEQLTRAPIRLWRWQHRWFRPQQKEEFRVEVSPKGEVVGFEHEIEEAANGANLEQHAARSIAEGFLTGVMKRNLDDLELVEAETEKRPARTDHTFTWKQKSVDLGDGSLRVAVEVDGDQVGGYREFVKIPEQWTRDYRRLRSRNEAAQTVDEVFWILLTVAMAIILVLRLRDHDVPGRLALVFGAIAAALYFLAQLNSFSLAEFGYQTTDPYSSFMANYFVRSLLSAFGLGVFIFLLVAASEPMYRESLPGQLSLRGNLSWQGLRSRSFLMANVVGLGLTFFFFAYQTVFYVVANKLGAWAPSDISFSNDLNTRVPWVAVLFGGFFPAVSEEMQFRAFAIPFLHRALRSWPLALVLAAFNWGFLHSAYPNQPFFIRGVEVGLGGIIMGLIMLKFGIVATMIWHYSVDALYSAFLMLRSPNHYMMVSGALTGGIMLIPLLAAAVAYWRSGTFTEEAPLTNASEGIRRGAPAEAVAAAEPGVAYRPLDSRRLAVAIVLAAAFGLLAFLPVYRFGQDAKVRLSRTEAERVADEYLKQQKIRVEDFRRVAWLEDNLDPQALRYFLERRTVRQADEVYRRGTSLLLWQVRYFRPLEKEEYDVFVDATSGSLVRERHELEESAPGASLSADDARKLAEKAVLDRGYRLADFDLQEQHPRKLRAREDYTFVWQARAGDSRNVGGTYYRLEVQIAGDRVVNVERFFKVPEDWTRQRATRRLANVILIGIGLIFVGLLAVGALALFIRQLRNHRIPWRAARKIGVLVAILSALAELNRLPTFYQQYDTSYPLATFRLFLGVGLLVTPLIAGLLAWVAAGLALSLWPDGWRIFSRTARRVWRRDAAVLIALSFAAAAGLGQLQAFVSAHFHTFMPVEINLPPSLFDSALPAAGFFLHALVYGIYYVAAAGVVLYMIREGWTRRVWWFWGGALLLLAVLGPWDAHSVREYVMGWAMQLVTLAVMAAVVIFFFRDNVLAYVGAALLLLAVEPAADLIRQPQPFYRWNGLLLAALLAIVLGWLLLPAGESEVPGL
jgi:membrane protease YdiL (CAAX protease family)